MKIGIVTYTHCYNQGADLQAYALTQVLKKYGHYAEILWFDRVPVSHLQQRKILRKALINRLCSNPLQGVGDIVMVLYKMGLNALRRRSVKTQAVIDGEASYDRFWESYIPHTKKLKHGDLLSLNYECYIAGSDQIWNWRLTGDIAPYFLMFTPSFAKKISYAASVSIDKIDDAYVQKYKEGLANLDAISVRETAGAELMRQYTDKPVYVVLDPTLLVARDDWRKIESDKIKFDFPYILSYSLNLSSKYMRLITRYAKKNNIKIINVTSSPTGSRCSWLIDVCNAGPREFLYLLDHAEAVFTNSFHGTVFSINFHKPFISILNPYSSVNTRVLSITQLLGLSENVVFDNAVREIKTFPEISYECVDEALTEQRRKSMDFLLGALNA